MTVREEMVTPTAPKPRMGVVATTCDLCGRTVDFDATGNGTYSSGWSTGYNIDRVAIVHGIGSNYPEGGSVEEEIFDVCPDCWTDRIVPLMATIGLKPRISDKDL